MNNEPKPMVGQIWHCSANEVDVTAMHFIKNGNMEWSDGENSDLEWTHKFMTFIPQNDLEWLAVNEPDWFHDDCDFIRRDKSDRPMYAANPSAAPVKMFTYYTRQQHRNERYRLGLDTKPHYKLINGQWGETK